MIVLPLSEGAGPNDTSISPRLSSPLHTFKQIKDLHILSNQEFAKHSFLLQ